MSLSCGTLRLAMPIAAHAAILNFILDQYPLPDSIIGIGNSLKPGMLTVKGSHDYLAHRHDPVAANRDCAHDAGRCAGLWR